MKTPPDVSIPRESGQKSAPLHDSLIGVEAFGRFLSTKVFFKELLNLRNTSRTSDKDDLL